MSEQFNPSAWVSGGSSSGGGKNISWFNLDDGQSADVRLLDPNPLDVWVHRILVNGKRYPTVCLGKKEDCPACKAENKASSRHIFNAIDRRDKNSKVLELNYKTFQLLRVVVGKMGDPTEYDITINRIGKGKDTQYPIFPGSKSPLTEAEKQSTKVELNTYYAKNRERMETLLRGELPRRERAEGNGEAVASGNPSSLNTSI